MRQYELQVLAADAALPVRYLTPTDMIERRPLAVRSGLLCWLQSLERSELRTTARLANQSTEKSLTGSSGSLAVETASESRRRPGPMRLEESVPHLLRRGRAPDVGRPDLARFEHGHHGVH